MSCATVIDGSRWRLVPKGADTIDKVGFLPTPTHRPIINAGHQDLPARVEADLAIHNAVIGNGGMPYWELNGAPRLQHAHCNGG